MAMINGDTVSGISGRESIFGFDGSDILMGLRRLDHLDGGDGNDVLRSGTGSDHFSGRIDDGDDRLFGDDDLFGGAGADTPDSVSQDDIFSLNSSGMAGNKGIEIFELDDTPMECGSEIIYSSH